MAQARADDQGLPEGVLAAWGREMAAIDDGDGPVDAFLRAACLSYTQPYAVDRAAAMLRADHGLANATPATMAACG
ncbi:MAG TPA: hypothetical protein VFN19_04425, partial [Candidatus Nanopelagicales bacterium]|nr:hypothetical protein [Candidatus Nanopelagicales bacterium]